MFNQLTAVNFPPLLWNAEAETVQLVTNADHRQSSYRILPRRTIQLWPYFRDMLEPAEPVDWFFIYKEKN